MIITIAYNCIIVKSKNNYKTGFTGFSQKKKRVRFQQQKKNSFFQIGNYWLESLVGSDHRKSRVDDRKLT